MQTCCEIVTRAAFGSRSQTRQISLLAAALVLCLSACGAGTEPLQLGVDAGIDAAPDAAFETSVADVRTTDARTVDTALAEDASPAVTDSAIDAARVLDSAIDGASDGGVAPLQEATLQAVVPLPPFRDVALGPNGLCATGLFFDGSSVQLGPHTVTAVGGTTGYVVCFDRSGVYQWHSVFAPSSASVPSVLSATSRGVFPDSVEIDAAGNVFVGGKFTNASFLFGSVRIAVRGDSNYLQTEMFVGSFGPTGNGRWVRQLGALVSHEDGCCNDQLNDLEVHGQDICVAGNIWGNTDLGSGLVQRPADRYAGIVSCFARDSGSHSWGAFYDRDSAAGVWSSVLWLASGDNGYLYGSGLGANDKPYAAAFRNGAMAWSHEWSGNHTFSSDRIVALDNGVALVGSFAGTMTPTGGAPPATSTSGNRTAYALEWNEDGSFRQSHYSTGAMRSTDVPDAIRGRTGETIFGLDILLGTAGFLGRSFGPPAGVSWIQNATVLVGVQDHTPRWSFHLPYPNEGTRTVNSALTNIDVYGETALVGTRFYRATTVLGTTYPSESHAALLLQLPSR